MRMDLQGQENGKPERDFDAGTGNVACTWKWENKIGLWARTEKNIQKVRPDVYCSPQPQHNPLKKPESFKSISYDRNLIPQNRLYRGRVGIAVMIKTRFLEMSCLNLCWEGG
jgi:hypothetical protein